MRFLCLALTAAGLTACVSTNAAVLDPTVKYQRTCAAGVKLFTSADRVAADYYEVALLHSKGESGWTDEKQMMASQRNKAAELGANGIILGDIREPNAGTKILGSLLGTGSERQGKAVAIYIPSDSARADHACAADRRPVADDDHRGTQSPFATPMTSSPSAAAPAVSAAVTPVVAPAAAPGPGSEEMVRLPDSQERSGLPVGTRWIVSLSQKLYYPVGCHAADALPEADKLYFDNEENPRSAGFKRSIVC